MNKQKLQEQIETMREELAKMETELAESEKVELTKGEYQFHAHGGVNTNVYVWATKVGVTRATKELAEIASKNMVTRNKLEAYVHQIDPDWRDLGIGNKAYRIVKDKNEYFITWDETFRTLGSVYMSQSTAEQICKWLNDGKIKL